MDKEELLEELKEIGIICSYKKYRKEIERLKLDNKNYRIYQLKLKKEIKQLKSDVKHWRDMFEVSESENV